MTLALRLDRSHGRSERDVAGRAPSVTASAIVIALVKVRIIFREFMEVRHAPVLLRRLTDGWVVLMAVCLLGSYFVGSALAG